GLLLYGAPNNWALTWQQLISPTADDLFGVAQWQDDTWAVGAHTTITGTAGTILHAASGAWQVLPSVPGVSLRGVAALGPGHAWAVGSGGALVELSGAGVGQVITSTSPTTQDLYGVAFGSDGAGWAVGGTSTGAPGGVILRYQNGAWSQFATLASVS